MLDTWAIQHRGDKMYTYIFILLPDCTIVLTAQRMDYFLGTISILSVVISPIQQLQCDGSQSCQLSVENPCPDVYKCYMFTCLHYYQIVHAECLHVYFTTRSYRRNVTASSHVSCLWRMQSWAGIHVQMYTNT